MKPRWILSVVVVALVLGLTGGFAIGSTPSDPPAMSRMHGTRDAAAACDAMHRSSAMNEMMQQMPPDLREQCDEMHGVMLHMMRSLEQMGHMMDGSGMMAGS